MSQNAVFESMAAYRNRSFNLSGEGEPVRVKESWSPQDFSNTLQIKPALGRVFVPQEDRPGNSRVIVISDSLLEEPLRIRYPSTRQKILLDGEELLDRRSDAARFSLSRS